MKRFLLSLVLMAFASAALAQPLASPENYAATATQGGGISEYLFQDITTLNPIISSSAGEVALMGMYAGPGIVGRDWIGTRTFKNEDGSYNTDLGWASEVEEVVPDKEFVITLREGWQWSDGTEMTVDDVIASTTIVADPAVESNYYSLCVIGENEEPVEFEKLSDYQYRATLPVAQVNGIINAQCAPIVPAHIFMPAYEADGAEGVKALWGVDTDPSEIVSGGPYMLSEFRPAERVVFEKNPTYGEFSTAADGSPLPGPDNWTVTLVEDQNQVLAAAVTDQTSFYYPSDLDQVRAMQEAVDGGTIGGNFLPNIGPGKLVDFMTYNFNNTDECKRTMFRNPTFRQAIAIMIDRDALVDAALGGLGFPAVDYRSVALEPFVSNNEPFEYAPEEGAEMLAAIGFSETDSDGVLINPDTGCRAEFELSFNSGNDRRSQSALVIAQLLEPYGVAVNPREVDTATWGDSIDGTSVEYEEAGNQRRVDYDAVIWGLAGGDIDNPSFSNGIPPGTNLNSWNKSTEDVEAWELLLAELDKQIEAELDLDARVALYQEQAEILREFLPMTPLISPAFHIYTDMGNVWPDESINALTAESPYIPGATRESLTAAE